MKFKECSTCFWNIKTHDKPCELCDRITHGMKYRPYCKVVEAGGTKVSEEKPREFWVATQAKYFGSAFNCNVYNATDKDVGNGLHVIDFKSFESLQKENESLKKELSVACKHIRDFHGPCEPDCNINLFLKRNEEL